MDIWVVMVYDHCEWEIMDVLFNVEAIEPLVAELFGESEDYIEIKVECWHRDDVDSPDASFYGVELYARDDYVKGE